MLTLNFYLRPRRLIIFCSFLAVTLRAVVNTARLFVPHPFNVQVFHQTHESWEERLHPAIFFQNISHHPYGCYMHDSIIDKDYMTVTISRCSEKSATFQKPWQGIDLILTTRTKSLLRCSFRRYGAWCSTNHTSPHPYFHRNVKIFSRKSVFIVPKPYFLSEVRHKFLFPKYFILSIKVLAPGLEAETRATITQLFVTSTWIGQEGKKKTTSGRITPRKFVCKMAVFVCMFWNMEYVFRSWIVRRTIYI